MAHVFQVTLVEVVALFLHKVGDHAVVALEMLRTDEKEALSFATLSWEHVVH